MEGIGTKRGRAFLRAIVSSTAIACLAAVAGCGGSDDDGPPQPTPTPAGQTPTPFATPSPTAGTPGPAPTSSFAPVDFLTSESGAIDYWPRWSPDGQTVLFSRSVSGTDDGRYVLYTIDASGGTPVALPGIPATLGATRASWSWSTDEIAFSGSPREGVFAIYVIAPDGSGLRELEEPDTGKVLNYPSWYPDGEFLAIVDYGSTPGEPAGVLKKIGVASPSTVVLTDLDEIYAGEPAVSPDGTTIAFPGQLNQGQPYNQDENRIWLLPEGGAPMQLDPEQGRTPDWSPDGRFLAFESTRGCSDGSYAIFIEPSEGGTATQVTDCVYNGNHAVWSPDQTHIAFSAVPPGATSGRGIAVFDVPAEFQ